MKTKKIIVFLIMIIVMLTISTTVFAGDDFLSDFSGDVENTASERVGKALSVALNIIQIIGITVAVVMLMVLGMKYMLAAPGDRAEIKKHAIVYIVGAIIMFGAAGIVEIIKQFGTNLPS